MQRTERLESIKAALVGAIATGTAFGGLALANVFLGLALTPWSVGLSGAIAAASGALFGLTYRYVIRQDPNPHLRSGVVLAFGLVRAMALADGELVRHLVLPLGLNMYEVAQVGVLGLESLMLFAIARWVLDGCLTQGWIHPFQGL